MSQQESDFLKELKLLVIKTLVGISVTVLGVALAFYFNTTNRLNNLEKQNSQIEIRKADKEVIEIQLNNINGKLSEISYMLNKREPKN